METSMDFLKNNQELKVIPSEIKGISNGIVKEITPSAFTVQLNNIDKDLLKIGDSVEIIVPVNNCLVRFEAKINSIDTNFVAFSLPNKFRRIQRREYTRVSVNIPVKLRELNTSTGVDSVANDLSGGGMRLISDRDFDINNLLEANFRILARKDIKTVLRILRINKSNDKEYTLAGEFKEISNIDKTAIIQLCFKRQLEIKSKEFKTD